MSHRRSVAEARFYVAEIPHPPGTPPGKSTLLSPSLCTTTPWVKVFLFFVAGATLLHKDSFKYLGMVFYRTLNMAKSAAHTSRLFLASAYRMQILCVTTLWQTDRTILCGLLRRMLFLVACMVVRYGILVFCRQAGSSLARCLRFICIF